LFGFILKKDPPADDNGLSGCRVPDWRARGEGARARRRNGGAETLASGLRADAPPSPTRLVHQERSLRDGINNGRLRFDHVTKLDSEW